MSGRGKGVEYCAWGKERKFWPSCAAFLHIRCSTRNWVGKQLKMDHFFFREVMATRFTKYLQWNFSANFYGQNCKTLCFQSIQFPYLALLSPASPSTVSPHTSVTHSSNHLPIHFVSHLKWDEWAVVYYKVFMLPENYLEMLKICYIRMFFNVKEKERRGVRIWMYLDAFVQVLVSGVGFLHMLRGHMPFHFLAVL